MGDEVLVQTADAIRGSIRAADSVIRWGGEEFMILAPHTDDAELGCGGAIARLLEGGTRVHIAVFSTAEESLPKGASLTRRYCTSFTR